MIAFRSLFVLRDAVQVLLDDARESRALLLHRRLHVGDGGLDNREWRLLRRSRRHMQ